MSLKKQFEEIATAYIKAFQQRHGYEISYWVGGYVGQIAVFIEEYYFNFDEIRYDIDHRVKKGLIFEWHNESGINYEHTHDLKGINFPSYAQGLRYEHQKPKK